MFEVGSTVKIGRWTYTREDNGAWPSDCDLAQGATSPFSLGCLNDDFVRDQGIEVTPPVKVPSVVDGQTLDEQIEAFLEEFCNVVPGSFGENDVKKALLALVDAVRDEHQWRPIDTAPKDGTVVLLCESEDQAYVTIGMFDGRRWNGVDHGNHMNAGLILSPDFWMPLPTFGGE